MKEIREMLRNFGRQVESGAPEIVLELPQASPVEFYIKIGESLQAYAVFDHKNEQFMVISRDKRIGRRFAGKTIEGGEIIPTFSHYFDIARDLSGEQRHGIEVFPDRTAKWYTTEQNAVVRYIGTPASADLGKWMTHIPKPISWPVASG